MFEYFVRLNSLKNGAVEDLQTASPSEWSTDYNATACARGFFVTITGK